MKPFRLPILVLLICLPVALLAFGVKLPGTDGAGVAGPMSVPTGDSELAWLHTTTNGANWERFVAGVGLAVRKVPGLTVDETRAFGDQTHNVPEVVLGMAGRPGKLRIRWYKTTNDVTAADWVRALAARTPAPLAVIGGGSSDRARELAVAMARQPSWVGEKPLLFFTTATADDVAVDEPDAQGNTQKKLVDVYGKRTFRFCFTNEQMAKAVLHFVWSQPELRPSGPQYWPLAAVASGMAAALDRPTVYNLAWGDDPFSEDLSSRFQSRVTTRLAPRARVINFQLPLSIGGFFRPNRAEAEAAQDIAHDAATRPPQRSLIVLPTVAPSARRVLMRICETLPDATRRLVAVNGDGFSVNVIYRDGSFAWPVEALPVPLVLFAHDNPVAWAEAGKAAAHPTGTDDVLYFSDMMRLVAEGVFPASGGPTSSADTLAGRLFDRSPPAFDPDGNRVGGTGEYILWLRPRSADDPAYLEVYTRDNRSDWVLVQRLPLPAGPIPAGGKE